METQENPQEKSYVDLSVEERRTLLDELVLKPMAEAGKAGKGVYNQGEAYRGYLLQDQDSRDPAVVRNIQLVIEMTKRYPGFVKGSIVQHPEVLDFNKKIHLQPIPSQIPAVVSSLVDLLIDQEAVFRSVGQFKIVTRTSHLTYQSSQPYIVVYVQPNASLDEIRTPFVEQFKDFKPAERALRFNQQDGPIVFTAVGDGLFKEYLSSHRMLPIYYDEQTNFVRPKPLKFKENPVQRLIRLGLEKTIK